ncbi:uncharacterized protein C8A04DRAFT_30108 [Dichotomopilus funicola]|uniref:Uncharacterized protein n=1 Tax=Dichotomopilus funicola TaxID=1934379 RepID=A0AAN6ZLS6_9PEZI|nr:hypothetical protein C8A04DRAFT_30108 [Dichotomopilus funicola]
MPYSTTLSVPISMRMADPSWRMADPPRPMGSTEALRLENEDLRKKNEELAAELDKLRIATAQSPTPAGPQRTSPTKSYMQLTSSSRIRKTAPHSTRLRTPEATTGSDKSSPAAEAVRAQRRKTWDSGSSRAARTPNGPGDGRAVPGYMQSTASSYQKRASQKGAVGQINHPARPEKYQVGTQFQTRRKKEYTEQQRQHQQPQQQQPVRRSLRQHSRQTQEPPRPDSPELPEEKVLTLQDFVPGDLRLSPPLPRIQSVPISRYSLPESMTTIIEVPDTP